MENLLLAASQFGIITIFLGSIAVISSENHGSEIVFVHFFVRKILVIKYNELTIHGRLLREACDKTSVSYITLRGVEALAQEQVVEVNNRNLF